MSALASTARRFWGRLAGLPPLRQDALLYACSALFAAGVLLGHGSADYKEWAAMAVGPYAVAAIGCEVVVRLRLRRRTTAAADGLASPAPAGSLHPARGTTILGLLVLAVVLPLSFQLVWRAHAHAGAQAQVEVAVIERAGDRAATGHDPYLRHPGSVGVSPSSDSHAIDADSYFAYLPGMVPFGMLNAASVPPEIGDARFTMAGFTILVAIVALLLTKGRRDRRWCAFQVLVVLPTGALPLVTGGDDLPVLALMLLGLVLAERRRPVAAGIVLGVAGALKFTAWPLLLVLALAARDPDGRPASGRYLTAAAAVLVPVVGLGIALGPHSFVENVVSFPLGLTSVHSPAASPLPGQALVALLPHWKKPITALLVVVGLALVVVLFVKRPPRTVAAAAAFTAFAATVATLLAPATRFGYLIYPVNLLFWAALVRSAPTGDGPPAEADTARAGGTAASGARPKPQLESSTW